METGVDMQMEFIFILTALVVGTIWIVIKGEDDEH
jgi:hypothetical protein